MAESGEEKKYFLRMSDSVTLGPFTQEELEERGINPDKTPGRQKDGR